MNLELNLIMYVMFKLVIIFLKKKVDIDKIY